MTSSPIILDNKRSNELVVKVKLPKIPDVPNKSELNCTQMEIKIETFRTTEESETVVTSSLSRNSTNTSHARPPSYLNFLLSLILLPGTHMEKELA